MTPIPYLFLTLTFVAVKNCALEEINPAPTQHEAPDNPVLLKILQTVDAATSNERLFDVTLKILESLCLCMRDTLKTKQMENNQLSQEAKALQTGDNVRVANKKVLDLYQRIYNKTCFDLREDLAMKVNKSGNITQEEDKERSTCGKKAIDDNTENYEMLTSQINPVSENEASLKKILHSTFVLTRDYHKFHMRKFNLFKNSHMSTDNSTKHSIIVILTFYPRQNGAQEDDKSPKIESVELNSTLYSHSPIDIDIIDTRYGRKDSDKDEDFLPKPATNCSLKSIYNFLLQSEQVNKTKVFKILRKKGTIKVYIDIPTKINHIDYSKVCCNNETEIPMCKIDFSNESFDTHEITTYLPEFKKRKKLHRDYKDTISKIKTLVKLYDRKINKSKLNGFHLKSIKNNIKNKHINTLAGVVHKLAATINNDGENVVAENQHFETLLNKKFNTELPVTKLSPITNYFTTEKYIFLNNTSSDESEMNAVLENTDSEETKEFITATDDDQYQNHNKLISKNIATETDSTGMSVKPLTLLGSELQGSVNTKATLYTDERSTALENDRKLKNHKVDFYLPTVNYSSFNEIQENISLDGENEFETISLQIRIDAETENVTKETPPDVTYNVTEINNTYANINTNTIDFSDNDKTLLITERYSESTAQNNSNSLDEINITSKQKLSSTPVHAKENSKGFYYLNADNSNFGTLINQSYNEDTEILSDKVTTTLAEITATTVTFEKLPNVLHNSDDEYSNMQVKQFEVTVTNKTLVKNRLKNEKIHKYKDTTNLPMDNLITAIKWDDSDFKTKTMNHNAFDDMATAKYSSKVFSGKDNSKLFFVSSDPEESLFSETKPSILNHETTYMTESGRSLFHRLTEPEVYPTNFENYIKEQDSFPNTADSARLVVEHKSKGSDTNFETNETLASKNYELPELLLTFENTTVNAEDKNTNADTRLDKFEPINNYTKDVKERTASILYPTKVYTALTTIVAKTVKDRIPETDNVLETKTSNYRTRSPSTMEPSPVMTNLFSTDNLPSKTVVISNDVMNNVKIVASDEENAKNMDNPSIDSIIKTGREIPDGVGSSKLTYPINGRIHTATGLTSMTTHDLEKHDSSKETDMKPTESLGLLNFMETIKTTVSSSMIIPFTDTKNVSIIEVNDARNNSSEFENVITENERTEIQMKTTSPTYTIFNSLHAATFNNEKQDIFDKNTIKNDRYKSSHSRDLVEEQNTLETDKEEDIRKIDSVPFFPVKSIPLMEFSEQPFGVKSEEPTSIVPSLDTKKTTKAFDTQSTFDSKAYRSKIEYNPIVSEKNFKITTETYFTVNQANNLVYSEQFFGVKNNETISIVPVLETYTRIKAFEPQSTFDSNADMSKKEYSPIVSKEKLKITTEPYLNDIQTNYLKFSEQLFDVKNDEPISIVPVLETNKTTKAFEAQSIFDSKVDRSKIQYSPIISEGKNKITTESYLTDVQINGLEFSEQPFGVNSENPILIVPVLDTKKPTKVFEAQPILGSNDDMSKKEYSPIVSEANLKITVEPYFSDKQTNDLEFFEQPFGVKNYEHITIVPVLETYRTTKAYEPRSTFVSNEDRSKIEYSPVVSEENLKITTEPYLSDKSNVMNVTNSLISSFSKSEYLDLKNTRKSKSIETLFFITPSTIDNKVYDETHFKNILTDIPLRKIVETREKNTAMSKSLHKLNKKNRVESFEKLKNHSNDSNVSDNITGITVNTLPHESTDTFADIEEFKSNQGLLDDFEHHEYFVKTNNMNNLNITISKEDEELLDTLTLKKQLKYTYSSTEKVAPTQSNVVKLSQQRKPDNLSATRLDDTDQEIKQVQYSSNNKKDSNISTTYLTRNSKTNNSRITRSTSVMKNSNINYYKVSSISTTLPFDDDSVPESEVKLIPTLQDFDESNVTKVPQQPEIRNRFDFPSKKTESDYTVNITPSSYGSQTEIIVIPRNEKDQSIPEDDKTITTYIISPNSIRDTLIADINLTQSVAELYNISSINSIEEDNNRVENIYDHNQVTSLVDQTHVGMPQNSNITKVKTEGNVETNTTVLRMETDNLESHSYDTEFILTEAPKNTNFIETAVNRNTPRQAENIYNAQIESVISITDSFGVLKNARLAESQTEKNSLNGPTANETDLLQSLQLIDRSDDQKISKSISMEKSTNETNLEAQSSLEDINNDFKKIINYLNESSYTDKSVAIDRSTRTVKPNKFDNTSMTQSQPTLMVNYANDKHKNTKVKMIEDHTVNSLNLPKENTTIIKINHESIAFEVSDKFGSEFGKTEPLSKISTMPSSEEMPPNFTPTFDEVTATWSITPFQRIINFNNHAYTESIIPENTNNIVFKAENEELKYNFNDVKTFKADKNYNAVDDSTDVLPQLTKSDYNNEILNKSFILELIKGNSSYNDSARLRIVATEKNSFDILNGTEHIDNIHIMKTNNFNGIKPAEYFKSDDSNISTINIKLLGPSKDFTSLKIIRPFISVKNGSNNQEDASKANNLRSLVMEDNISEEQSNVIKKELLPTTKHSFEPPNTNDIVLDSHFPFLNNSNLGLVERYAETSNNTKVDLTAYDTYKSSSKPVPGSDIYESSKTINQTNYGNNQDALTTAEYDIKKDVTENTTLTGHPIPFQFINYSSGNEDATGITTEIIKLSTTSNHYSDKIDLLRTTEALLNVSDNNIEKHEYDKVTASDQHKYEQDKLTTGEKHANVNKKTFSDATFVNVSENEINKEPLKQLLVIHSNKTLITSTLKPTGKIGQIDSETKYDKLKSNELAVDVSINSSKNEIDGPKLVLSNEGSIDIQGHDATNTKFIDSATILNTQKSISYSNYVTDKTNNLPVSKHQLYYIAIKSETRSNNETEFITYDNMHRNDSSLLEKHDTVTDKTVTSSNLIGDYLVQEEHNDSFTEAIFEAENINRIKESNVLLATKNIEDSITVSSIDDNKFDITKEDSYNTTQANNSFKTAKESLSKHNIRSGIFNQTQSNIEVMENFNFSKINFMDTDNIKSTTEKSSTATHQLESDAFQSITDSLPSTKDSYMETQNTNTELSRDQNEPANETYSMKITESLPSTKESYMKTENTNTKVSKDRNEPTNETYSIKITELLPFTKESYVEIQNTNTELSRDQNEPANETYSMKITESLPSTKEFYMETQNTNTELSRDQNEPANETYSTKITESLPSTKESYMKTENTNTKVSKDRNEPTNETYSIKITELLPFTKESYVEIQNTNTELSRDQNEPTNETYSMKKQTAKNNDTLTPSSVAESHVTGNDFHDMKAIKFESKTKTQLELIKTVSDMNTKPTAFDNLFKTTEQIDLDTTVMARSSYVENLNLSSNTPFIVPVSESQILFTAKNSIENLGDRYFSLDDISDTLSSQYGIRNLEHQNDMGNTKKSSYVVKNEHNNGNFTEDTNLSFSKTYEDKEVQVFTEYHLNPNNSQIKSQPIKEINSFDTELEFAGTSLGKTTEAIYDTLEKNDETNSIGSGKLSYLGDTTKKSVATESTLDFMNFTYPVDHIAGKTNNVSKHKVKKQHFSKLRKIDNLIPNSTKPLDDILSKTDEGTTVNDITSSQNETKNDLAQNFVHEVTGLSKSETYTYTKPFPLIKNFEIEPIVTENYVKPTITQNQKETMFDDDHLFLETGVTSHSEIISSLPNASFQEKSVRFSNEVTNSLNKNERLVKTSENERASSSLNTKYTVESFQAGTEILSDSEKYYEITSELSVAHMGDEVVSNNEGIEKTEIFNTFNKTTDSKSKNKSNISFPLKSLDESDEVKILRERTTRQKLNEVDTTLDTTEESFVTKELRNEIHKIETTVDFPLEISDLHEHLPNLSTLEKSEMNASTDESVEFKYDKNLNSSKEIHQSTNSNEYYTDDQNTSNAMPINGKGLFDETIEVINKDTKINHNANLPTNEAINDQIVEPITLNSDLSWKPESFHEYNSTVNTPPLITTIENSIVVSDHFNTRENYTINTSNYSTILNNWKYFNEEKRLNSTVLSNTDKDVNDTNDSNEIITDMLAIIETATNSYKHYMDDLTVLDTTNIHKTTDAILTNGNQTRLDVQSTENPIPNKLDKTKELGETIPQEKILDFPKITTDNRFDDLKQLSIPTESELREYDTPQMFDTATEFDQLHVVSTPVPFSSENDGISSPANKIPYTVSTLIVNNTHQNDKTNSFFTNSSSKITDNNLNYVDNSFSIDNIKITPHDKEKIANDTSINKVVDDFMLSNITSTISEKKLVNYLETATKPETKPYSDDIMSTTNTEENKSNINKTVTISDARILTLLNKIRGSFNGFKNFDNVKVLDEITESYHAAWSTQVMETNPYVIETNIYPDIEQNKLLDDAEIAHITNHELRSKSSTDVIIPIQSGRLNHYLEEINNFGDRSYGNVLRNNDNQTNFQDYTLIIDTSNLESTNHEGKFKATSVLKYTPNIKTFSTINQIATEANNDYENMKMNESILKNSSPTKDFLSETGLFTTLQSETVSQNMLTSHDLGDENHSIIDSYTVYPPNNNKLKITEPDNSKIESNVMQNTPTYFYMKDARVEQLQNSDNINRIFTETEFNLITQGQSTKPIEFSLEEISTGQPENTEEHFVTNPTITLSTSEVPTVPSDIETLKNKEYKNEIEVSIFTDRIEPYGTISITDENIITKRNAPMNFVTIVPNLVDDSKSPREIKPATDGSISFNIPGGIAVHVSDLKFELVPTLNENNTPQIVPKLHGRFNVSLNMDSNKAAYPVDTNKNLNIFNKVNTHEDNLYSSKAESNPVFVSHLKNDNLTQNFSQKNLLDKMTEKLYFSDFVNDKNKLLNVTINNIPTSTLTKYLPATTNFIWDTSKNANVTRREKSDESISPATTEYTNSVHQTVTLMVEQENISQNPQLNTSSTTSKKYLQTNLKIFETDNDKKYIVEDKNELNSNTLNSSTIQDNLGLNNINVKINLNNSISFLSTEEIPTSFKNMESEKIISGIRTYHSGRRYEDTGHIIHIPDKDVTVITGNKSMDGNTLDDFRIIEKQFNISTTTNPAYTTKKLVNLTNVFLNDAHKVNTTNDTLTDSDHSLKIAVTITEKENPERTLITKHAINKENELNYISDQNYSETNTHASTGSVPVITECSPRTDVIMNEKTENIDNLTTTNQVASLNRVGVTASTNDEIITNVRSDVLPAILEHSPNVKLITITEKGNSGLTTMSQNVDSVKKTYLATPVKNSNSSQLPESERYTLSPAVPEVTIVDKVNVNDSSKHQNHKSIQILEKVITEKEHVKGVQEVKNNAEIKGNFSTDSSYWNPKNVKKAVVLLSSKWTKRYRSVTKHNTELFTTTAFNLLHTLPIKNNSNDRKKNKNASKINEQQNIKLRLVANTKENNITTITGKMANNLDSKAKKAALSSNRQVYATSRPVFKIRKEITYNTYRPLAKEEMDPSELDKIISSFPKLITKKVKTKNPQQVKNYHETSYGSKRKNNTEHDDVHNKSSIYDPLDKKNLYPIKKMITPRKVLKRLKIANKKKHIVTMNTKEFFSRRFGVTRVDKIDDILKLYPKPALQLKPVTSKPKSVVLRPKFDSFNILTKKPSIMKRVITQNLDRDYFRDLNSPNYRRSGPIWGNIVDKMHGNMNPPYRTGFGDPVIDTPYYIPTVMKPKFLRDRVNSIRSYIYNAEKKPNYRRHFISEHDEAEHDYVAQYSKDEDTDVPLYHYTRPKKTIFFLSPTVPYNRYF